MSDDAMRGILFGQLVPGQAGNSGRRPRGKSKVDSQERIKLSDTERALLEIASRKMRVKGDGGSTESISLLDAVLRKTVQSALEGSPMSQRTIIALFAHAQHTDAIAKQQTADFWRDYKERATRAIEAARQAGEAEPRFFPHPDDVVIGAGDEVRIIGPIDEDEARRVEDITELRDLLILQYHYEGRRGVLPYDPNQSEDDNESSAMLFAMLLNRYLPPRSRLTDREMEKSVLFPPHETKRQLEAILRKRWRAFKPELRRVPVLPLLRYAKPFLAGYSDLFRRLMDEGKAGVVRSTDEIAVELVELFQVLRAEERGPRSPQSHIGQ